MQVTVVITSINNKHDTSIPTIEACCKTQGWDLVVVGDQKTPDMDLTHGTYLSPKDQLALPYKLSKQLPWNCYERKNIGYLYAYHQGADYIISTDDDNYPINGWDSMIDFFSYEEGPALFGKFGLGNPWEYFNPTINTIWPRGLPLSALHSTTVLDKCKYKDIGIISGLVNQCPDFDALGHLYFDSVIWKFKDNLFLFKQPDTIAPYNTQNTVIRRDLLPLQMLAVGIGRASDIWASYICQHVIKAKDIGVLYISPTVYQDRNIHNPIQDFKDEKETLLYTEELNRVLVRNSSPKSSLIDSYYNLCNTVAAFFPDNFMKDLESWLQDLG